MAADRAIYEHIVTSIVDGRLSDDFSLEDYDEPGQPIRMADGALDGIHVYHMAPPELPDDIVQTIAGAFELSCAGGRDAADATLSQLLAQYRAIGLVDQIQQAVMDVAQRVPAQALYGSAVLPILTSTDKEMVKLGLAVLEMFNEPDEMMKEVVRNLALSDEFAIFCAWNAQKWANGNQELLEMARRVRGWGRVHIVAMLEPTTDEVRDWLFRDGVDNDVMPEYSALVCYVKAGVAERLAGEMGHDDFSAATAIVRSAMGDGPVPGIPALDDPKAEFGRYVAQAARQTLDLDDCECLLAIARFARDRGWDDLVASCEALLRTDAVRSMLVGELAQGRGVELAQVLGLPYKDALLEALRADFDRLYPHCHWLMDVPAYLDAVLDLYRERVPLEGIEDDPRDEIGLSEEFDRYNTLDFLVQSLRHKLPTGLDFVLRTLTSPTVRNRTLSHRALRCWVSDEGRPLAEVSPEAYQRLRYAYDREPREDIRANMLPLLEGATEFDGDLM